MLSFEFPVCILSTNLISGNHVPILFFLLTCLRTGYFVATAPGGDQEQSVLVSGKKPSVRQFTDLILGDTVC